MNRFLFLFSLFPFFFFFFAPPLPKKKKKKCANKTSLNGTEVKPLHSILYSWTVSFQILLSQGTKLIPDARSDQISMSSAWWDFKIGLENSSWVLCFGRVWSDASEMLINERYSKSQPFLRVHILRKWPFFFYKSPANYLNRNLEGFSQNFDFVRLLEKKLSEYRPLVKKHLSFNGFYAQSPQWGTCRMENFSLPLRRKLVLKTYIDKKQVWERETIEIQGTLKT